MSSSSSYGVSAASSECDLVEGAGDEFAGVPLLLPVLNVRDFVVREGVTERGFGSTLRFLAGGFFVAAVAVPFFVLEGAGRFFETIVGSEPVSVDGTGTEESRKGECVRSPSSFFLNDAIAFIFCTSGSLMD